MTVYIDPRAPREVDQLIRADAAKRGEQVMPARPFPWNRKATDQKVIAERKWQARTMAPKPQKPCDVGLFSDEHKQMGLFGK